MRIPTTFTAVALTLGLTLGLGAVSAQAATERYAIDQAHSFIQFKISHLGYSWLVGRFNDFDGDFTYDTQNPANSAINITVDTASIDSNHTERDRHLRGSDFLNVSAYPEARFTTTGFQQGDNGTATLEGELTLHGTTRPVSIDVTQVGSGVDPWGGFRRGFEGTMQLRRADFGIDYNLGEAAEVMELYLSVEGVRQD